MLFRFCLYGFLKNQRYFEPFLMLLFLDRGLSFFAIGLLLASRDLTVNLLEIPSGALADSFGRRGAMILSFVAYIAAFLTLGLATRLGVFFVGMILYGVGDTFRTGTHKSMIFEWLRQQRRSDERTVIYGLTRSWSQIGSAVSGLVAAGLVFFSGSYQFVFFVSIVPYLLNLINLATYPRVLDGEYDRATSIGEAVGWLKRTFVRSVADRSLRGLILESMGWGGVFAAVKDYLQPILQSAALIGMASLLRWRGMEGAGNLSGWNEAQTTAVLLGPVYAVLFLLSAWASRHAHGWVERAGSEAKGVDALWLASLIVFVGIGVAGWFDVHFALVVGLIGLYVLKNIWRPIVVTRFDRHSRPEEGATVLSIESQARRLAAMGLSPLLGWTIDMVGAHHLGGRFWPIGLLGGTVALVILATVRRGSSRNGGLGDARG